MSFVIPQKVYEKPQTGSYIGVLADVANLGTLPTKYGPRPTARLVWILNAKDSEGNFFRVMKQGRASMGPKSNLFKDVTDILNGPVPDNYDLEQLIGRNNMLVVRRKEEIVNGVKKIYANVESILPVPSGTPLFTIPQDFKRFKDLQQNQNGSSPAQQTAAPAAAAPVSTPAQQEVADEDIPF